MPRLIVIKGTDEGKSFDLTANIIGIGRERTNGIHLHDTEISRRHLELRAADNGQYRLIDLGSINGTLVNTRPVKDHLLQSGDHIQLGQTILVYSTSRPEKAANEDLASRISMVSRHDLEIPSAIVKTISETAGSQILARPDQAGNTTWLKTRLANLSIMYETIQAVSHILDVDVLLDRIMELIFGSIEADHGCIMLRSPDSGEFEPKAVRVRFPEQMTEKIVISRTIMEYVLREKQGILVSDASKDERFSAGQSIVRFNLREVICVPMRGRHETLGVLFLDTTSTVRDMVAAGSEHGKFTEDHIALAIAIAHQAALAIEETRYHHALVQAERLAAVGQTVAALSHHIKNIMQGVIFGSNLVNTALDESNDALLRKGWAMVQRNQGRIHDLMLDMLSFSKDREPSIQSTDLNQIIEDVAEVVAGRAQEKNIRLEVKPSSSLPKVPADPEGVHRSVLNIVSNALDAVEERDQASVVIQTKLESDGEWARIVVVDNGPGIPPDQIEVIFRPFVSTKGARGTGLGLAVSRKIFLEHGGDILVESQIGVGSKFILRLPMKSPLANEYPSGVYPNTGAMTPPEPD
ncbi:ATP-binding protein [Tuwongella immobilis]|uniref:histidine kinase n=1 Tax=Tuwongella immobilis TaxID=692036 RepID=A0A6C2YX95_9BACT|nr:ATP-binding protein [Tuwongella immobilis]VIP05743.1 sensor protein atos : Histidine kinase OS=Singulisphaera acidiphila (strain ATCC BAA-1392 / DSM 18658 / VKM B-2454 / MOB10) GN=Sinac_1319 PE=4 SV=1: FHA: GAF: HATPase_c [Tuwongella immobilis]VTS08842.1 sensor protein atos : Histidine kinase OS=Singulisphaera acidiphila (strain ATCC BAA-1392 / DSM 18658 / VKM B-2454 / MOB10) GN=Sinac_1319 PE=4 SV=1: FHA: GAF: HATPase_c [Tuwongella immobilis]